MERTTSRRSGFGERVGVLTSGALLAACLCTSVWASPQGAHVVAGSAAVEQNGASTVIQAANNTIINYESFNIAGGETVQFVQPDAMARVLNRIQSADPTRIDGTLLANGQVYIVNPAGVYFGNGALVNVGALYAAAASISNQDFLAGIDRFTGGAGAVVNYGSIFGDFVHLMGAEVANHGQVNARLVTMTAGPDALIGDVDGHVFVRIEGGAAQVAAALKKQAAGVENTGTIAADTVVMSAGDLYSLAIRNTGTVRAGAITVQGTGGGVIEVGGTLDASNLAPGGQGGRITVTGESVYVNDADIDASGLAGGGVILVGGDYQGSGELRRSDVTYVSAESLIRADALANGDGGQAVIWSDGNTAFFGDVSAQGGLAGGDGGLVEVSGKGALAFSGSVDTSAPVGATGTLLLDPANLDLIAAGGANDGELPTFDAAAGGAVDWTIDAPAIVASLVTNDVSMAAVNTITVSAAIDASGTGAAHSLSLTATTINVNAGITLFAGSAFNLTATTATVSAAIDAYAINVTADNLTVTPATGSLIGTLVAFETKTVGEVIYIGDNPGAGLAIASNEMNKVVVPVGGTLTIGTPGRSGDVYFDNIGSGAGGAFENIDGHVVVNADGPGGDIFVRNGYSQQGDGVNATSLTHNADPIDITGDMNVAGDYTANTSHVRFHGASTITVQNDLDWTGVAAVTLSDAGAHQATFVAGGAVTFGGTVDSAGGNDSLSVTSGADVGVNGAIGGTSPLADVTVDTNDTGNVTFAAIDMTGDLEVLDTNILTFDGDVGATDRPWRITADDTNINIRVELYGDLTANSTITIGTLLGSGGDLEVHGVRTITSTLGSIVMDIFDGTIDLQDVPDGGTFTVSAGTLIVLDTVENTNATEVSLDVSSGNFLLGGVLIGDIGRNGAAPLHDVTANANNSGDVIFGHIDADGDVAVLNAWDVGWFGSTGGTVIPSSIQATAANVAGLMIVWGHLRATGDVTLGTRGAGILGDIDLVTVSGSVPRVTSVNGAVDMATVGNTIDMFSFSTAGATFEVTAGTSATLGPIDDGAFFGNSLTVDAGNAGAGGVTMGAVGATSPLVNVTVDVNDNGDATFAAADLTGDFAIQNANVVTFNGAVGNTSPPASITANDADVNTRIALAANLTAQGNVELGTNTATGGDIDVTGARTVTSNNAAVTMNQTGGAIDLRDVGANPFTVSAGTNAYVGSVNDATNRASLNVNSGLAGAGDATLGTSGDQGALVDVNFNLNNNGDATFGALDASGNVVVTNAVNVAWTGAVGANTTPASINAPAAQVSGNMTIQADLTATGGVTLGTGGNLRMISNAGASVSVTSVNNAVDMGTVGGAFTLSDLSGLGATFGVSAGTAVTLPAVDAIAGLPSLAIDTGTAGAGGLTIGAVGATGALTDFTVDMHQQGAVAFAGTIDASGAVSVTNADLVTFNAVVGGTTAPSVVEVGAQDLAVNAAIHTTDMRMQPYTADRNMTVGAAAGGQFSVDATEMNRVYTSGELRIGSDALDQTGTITFQSIGSGAGEAFEHITGSVSIFADGVGGIVDFQGGYNHTTGTTLTVTADPIDVNGDVTQPGAITWATDEVRFHGAYTIRSTGGNVDWSAVDAVTLSDAGPSQTATLQADAGSVTVGDGATHPGAIDSSSLANACPLNVIAGTNVSLLGLIGVNNLLESIEVLAGGQVDLNTTGVQGLLDVNGASIHLIGTEYASTDGGVVIMNGPIQLTGAGPTVTIRTDRLAGHTIQCTSTIDGALALNLDAGGADVTVGNAIGAAVSPVSLSVLGGTVNLHNVTTTGFQHVIGTQINLNGMLYESTTAGEIRFSGPVALLGGPTNIQTAGAAGDDILFYGAGTIDGAQPLTLNAGSADVVVQGNVGDTTPLTIFGIAADVIDVADVTTTDGQLYVGWTRTDLNGTSYTNTGFGAIGFVGPVSLEGAGPTTIATNGTAGDDVTFDTTVDGTVDLIVNAGAAGNVAFDGPAGWTTPLASLTVTGNQVDLVEVVTDGAQDVTGALINLGGMLYVSNTAGAIRFDGPVQLTTGGVQIDVQTAGNVGDDVTFTSTIDGAEVLAVGAFFGDATFAGHIGGTTPLEGFAATALNLAVANVITTDGMALLGLVNTDLNGTTYTATTTGSIVFPGLAVNLANGPITMATPGGVGEDVVIGGTLDGAQALNVDVGASGNFEVWDIVGGTTPLASLTVTNAAQVLLPAGVTTVGAQTYTVSDVVRATGIFTTTGADIRVNGNVRLEGDTLFTTGATGNVRVTGTTDADAAANNWDFIVQAGDDAALGGAVGATNRVNNLTVVGDNVAVNDAYTKQDQTFAVNAVDGLLEFLSPAGNPDRVYSSSGGGIFLNVIGRGAVPQTATMYNAGGNTAFLAAGSVQMGQNEKLTVLGDLLIHAGGGVFLGDVSTLGSASITGSGITLLSRAPGNVLNYRGQVVSDTGLDIVVGSALAFSTTPTIAGGRTVTIGTPDPGAVTNAPAGVSVIHMSPLSRQQFFFQGQVLDLRAVFGDGGDAGASTENLVYALAGPLPAEDAAVMPVIVPAPPQADHLHSVGVFTRDLSPREMLDYLARGAVLDDHDLAYARATGPSMLWSDPPPSNFRVARQRLDAQAVGTVLDAYQNAFLTEDGSPRPNGEIRQEIADALGGGTDSDVLQRMRLVLEALRSLGLGPVEYDNARAALLGTALPDGMTPGAFEDRVGGGGDSGE